MTPDEIRHVNLSDLTATYRDVAIARAGRIERSRLGEHKLLPSPWRVRALMRFYGLLEIASLADVIPAKLPQDFVGRSRQELNSRSAQRVYEDDSPMILPQVFRARLEGMEESDEVGREAQAEVDGQSSLVQHLLCLYGAASHDRDIMIFLGMTAGRDDRPVDSLMQSLESQNGFLVSFADSFATSGDVDTLNVFRKFVRYCLDMHQVLSEAREYPPLELAIRQFHADWLGKYVFLENVAKQALMKVRQWRSSQSGEERRLSDVSFDRLDDAVLDMFHRPDLPGAWRRFVRELSPSGKL